MLATDFSGLPEYLKPKLRLFLSADLVGSTAFKQKPSYPLKSEQEERDAPPGPHWLESITDFYSKFRAEFSQQWSEFADSAAQDSVWPTGNSPEFWKGIGDEIVYVKELSHPKEVAGTVWVWMRTLRRYRAALKAKKSPLDIKATAWIGGFPLNNAEVVFDSSIEHSCAPADDARLNHFQQLEAYYSDEGRKSSYVRDFIGTSIDTGFRLATKSSPRRMSVSIEVVLMITSYRPPEEKFGPIKIHFDGYESFKGVLGGKPYPVFWVDMFCTEGRTDSPKDAILTADVELAEAENKLLGKQECHEDQLHSFCEKFIKANDQHIIRPFICDCRDGGFTKMPANYPEKLKAWHKKILAEKSKLESELSYDSSPPDADGSVSDVVAPKMASSLLKEWITEVFPKKRSIARKCSQKEDADPATSTRKRTGKKNKRKTRAR